MMTIPFYLYSKKTISLLLGTQKNVNEYTSPVEIE